MTSESNHQERHIFTLTEHLSELRKRLLRCLIAFCLASVVGLFFAKQSFVILSQPLERILPPDTSFIAIHALEAWLVYLKVGLLGGALLSSPYWFHEAWGFISPGLHKHERKWSLPIGFILGFLFLGGALFGYFVVFPLGFDALLTVMSNTDIRFMPTMGMYFSFVVRLLLAFGTVFEMPVVVFVLAYTGIVSFKKLFSFQKYIILASLILAAVLTPPDPVTQVMMALPLVIFYELGLGLAWLFARNKHRVSEELQKPSN